MAEAAGGERAESGERRAESGERRAESVGGLDSVVGASSEIGCDSLGCGVTNM